MSNELPSFERAEYVAPPEAQAQLAPEYQYQSTPNQGTAGAQGAASTSWLDQKPDSFVMALLGGLAAAIAGCIGYAAFTIITHIEIGFVALFLGAFIAKMMLLADGGVGGRKHQIAAVVLTYFSISMAALVEAAWHLNSSGTDLSKISAKGYGILVVLGLASPFLALTHILNGLIGLFILFIAMQRAWKVAAGGQQNG
jgi:hypothetical protein